MLKPLLLLSLFAGAMAGCGAQPGNALAIYHRDSHNAPPMARADKPGFYALFPGDGVSPLSEPIFLRPGDSFGFQIDEGRIAGAYKKAGRMTVIPLDGVLTTEYVWKYQGEKPH